MIHAVVVTYDSADVIGDCLSSLAEALAACGESRVVVVDNASSDETLDLVAASPVEAQVVASPDNRGYAAGVNAGIDLAGIGDHVLVMNPDVRLDPLAVVRLVEQFTRPEVGIAVPRILRPDGTTHRSLRREPTIAGCLADAVLGGRLAGRLGLGETEGRSVSYESDANADWATGAVMLVSSDCRRAVGPWDESYFLYSEETDFALRARDAGFLLRYTPTAVAQHLSGDQHRSPSLWALSAVNRVELFRRRRGRAPGALYAAAVIVNEGLRVREPIHRAALVALLRGRGGRELAVAAAAHRDGWLCLSGQDWWYHNRAHSDFQLMSRVARQHPVLLVNSMGMRVPTRGRSTNPARRIARKAGSVARGLRRPLPGRPLFHVVTPLSVPVSGSPRLRRINARLVRGQVDIAARWLGIRRPDIVVTLPTAWEVVRDMERRTLIYNRSDKHSAFTEADQDAIRQLEDELLASADVVEYVSHQLMEDEAAATGSRARFLDHGVDLVLFDPASVETEPDDLRKIPHPRIGYFGGLNGYQIDFALLERVADAHPSAHLVLIGRADVPLDALAARPNVHVLGPRPHEEIPRYGVGFDVAIMPWLTNEWIRHANPIKLKEYLALGLQVVTTPFAEAERYRDLITIASGDDFVAAVGRRLVANDGMAAVRRAAVADQSWERRAEELIAHARAAQREPARGRPPVPTQSSAPGFEAHPDLTAHDPERQMQSPSLQPQQ